MADVTPRGDRVFGPGPHDDANPCEFHTSDGWVMVDAMLSILSGLATIVLVVLRHPFRLVLVLALVGTLAGWWVP